MAQTLAYSGTSSGTYGLNDTRTVSVSGQSVSNARSTGLVQVLVYCSCNAYGQSYNINASIGSYSGARSGKLFDSSNYTGTYISIDIPVPTSFDVNSISQISVWDSTSNASKVFLKGNTQYVYAYYEVPTACGAPAYITMAGLQNDAYLHEGNVTTLAWSGATAGSYNAITGYYVYKNGNYYTYVSDASGYGSGSCAVTAPSAGEGDTYTIVTHGTVSGLDSSASTGRVLYAYGNVTAPASISLSNETPDAGATTRLSWSGAQSGGNNNIASYKVYRRASSSEAWALLTTVTTKNTDVTAPNTMGGTYQYCVASVGTRGDESAKSSNVTLTAKVYTTDPPTEIALSAETWTTGTVRLSWTAATCTSGSSITRYYIQQRVKSYGGNYSAWADLTNVTGTSYTFTPALTAGQTAQYRIRALSNKSVYSSYAQSSNDLYRPYAPSAPTSFTATPTVYNTGEVFLNWTASTVTGGNVSRYYIEYARNTGNGYSDWQNLANTANNYYSLEPSGFSVGNVIKYRVRALSEDGLYSGYAVSNEIKKAGKPTAPTTVKLAGNAADCYALAGANVALSWSGAAAGTNNAIAGYDIYRNGSYLTTVTTTATSGSETVTAPSAGDNDSYTIVTVGVVADLNSSASTARRLYGYSHVSAPTSVELANETPDAGATTRLSWSGAQSGGNNNIASYKVYRRASSSEAWALLTTVTTTNTNVTAPTTVGNSYEYCVASIGTRGDESEKSNPVTLTAKEYSTNPPTDIILSIETWIGGTVRLSWTAATCTSGSSISRYYIQQRVKNYSGNYGSWADLTNVTGTSYTFTPTLTAGQTAQYRIRALSNKSVYSSYAQASNQLYRPYEPSAPTSVTASPVIYNTGEVFLNWNAATVMGGTVSKYAIEYARNTGNGFSDWQNLAETANNYFNYEPSSLSPGYILKYRVRALSTDGLYGDYAVSNEIHKASNPAAPSTFTVTPTAYNDGEISLAWSGASDADGDIVGYRIDYNTSKNNTSWGGWQELVSINSTAASGSYAYTPEGFERGAYRKYRICTLDSLSLVSAYKESATVYRGLAPSAPVITAPAAGIYEAVTALAWNASAPPDSYPISGYQVQYSKNGGQSWTQHANVTSGLSVDISSVFNSLSRGDTVLFRVRAYNTVNIYGDYNVTGIIQRNRLPATPVILLPYNGAETFSKSPIILIKAPSEPDAQTHTLQYKVGNAEWNDIPGYVNMPGDTFYCVFRAPTYGDGVTALCSNNPAILKDSNDKILIVSKNETLSFRLVDSLGATGAIVSILIRMLPFEFTDPTLYVGTTPIKAVHVNELRTFIDKTLTYYSATAFDWGETIVAHYTSLRLFKNHVEDMRTAISRALAKLNGTEAGKIIATPTYTDLSDYKPRASALEELRNIINNI